MLEVVGQDIISGNMGFIGTDPDRLYRMGAAEKTEDVTVTGNPAVLDNATGKPFRDLHIYGRSEQVTTTGAQLLISTKEQESNVGVTLTKKENGLWHLEGTNTEATSMNIRLVEPTEHFKLPEGTYTISVDAVGIYQQLSVTTARVKNPDDGSSQEWTIIASTKSNSSTKFVCDGTEEALSLFVIFDGNATLNCDLYVMLNSGDAALPWEPYTGGKPSPSPDYPQEIVSAGEDGNLNVMVRGKNLVCPFTESIQIKSGEAVLDYDSKSQIIHVHGTTTIKQGLYAEDYKIEFPKNQEVTLSYDLISGNIPRGTIIQFSDFTTLGITCTDTIKSATGNWNKEGYPGYIMFVVDIPVGETVDFKIKVQLERGSAATYYEPYHEPQSTSVTTPNGLPGIPVTSGGNYTDENGRQWICDEVDLGRGVRVQRVRIKALSPDLAWSYRKTDRGNNNFQVRIYNADVATIRNECLCNIMRYTGNGWDDIPQNLPKIYANDQEITISFLPNSEYSSLEVFKQLLTNVKSVIYYALATPIETPLTASEIAAYKAMRTYRGTTIVEAEDKAGISATYKRSAKTDNTSAEKKIEESEKKEYDES